MYRNESANRKNCALGPHIVSSRHARHVGGAVEVAWPERPCIKSGDANYCPCVQRLKHELDSLQDRRFEKFREPRLVAIQASLLDSPSRHHDTSACAGPRRVRFIKKKVMQGPPAEWSVTTQELSQKAT
jgi:hypothetical protein